MKSRGWSLVALTVCTLPLARAQHTGTVGRTPDSQPDLQGVWLSNRATPLERPKALEGRPSLTNEEVAELKIRGARLLVDGDNDFAAGDAFFLAAWDNVQRYKSANSTSSVLEMIEREFDHRTSLVVDPSNGRIPPTTPEGRQRQAASIGQQTGVSVAAGTAPEWPRSLTVGCGPWPAPRA